MNKKLRVSLAAISILALSPLAVKYAVSLSEESAKKTIPALQYAADLKDKTIMVTDQSIRLTSRVSYKLHAQLRRFWGVDVDWGKGKFLWFGESREEVFLAGIKHNVEGMHRFVVFLEAIHQKDVIQDELDIKIHVLGMQRYTPYTSYEVAIILANPVGAVDAYNNRTLYEGVNVRDFIYDSKGKLSFADELKVTKRHLKRYEEFWVDFMFDHDYFEDTQNNWKKLNYVLNKL